MYWTTGDGCHIDLVVVADGERPPTPRLLVKDAEGSQLGTFSTMREIGAAMDLTDIILRD